jgi:phospholipid transport system substrate-binding protein
LNGRIAALIGHLLQTRISRGIEMSDQRLISDKRLTIVPAGVRLRDQQSSSSGVIKHESAVKPVVGTALVRFVKGVALPLAVIAGLSLAPPPAAADDVSIAFIRSLCDQAVSVIRSDMQLAGKAAYFQQMIDRDFDLTGICRFVLGPYWRVASPADRQQFRSLFADRLVHIYGRQLAEAGDGNFVVTGSRTGPDGVIVTSQIIRPQAGPIAVDWRLGISDGLYKARTSPSMASAWRWPSARRSRNSSRAGADGSGYCSRRCAKRVEHSMAKGSTISAIRPQAGETGREAGGSKAARSVL